MNTINKYNTSSNKKIFYLIRIVAFTILLFLQFFLSSCFTNNEDEKIDKKSDTFNLKTSRYTIDEISPNDFKYIPPKNDPDINNEYINNEKDIYGPYSIINDYLGQNPDAPGWPKFPRRILNITDSVRHETTLSFGSKGSIFDIIEWEATNSIVFGMGTSSQLMLIKTSYDAASLLTKEIDGKIYLNYEEDVDFIAQCIYNSGLDIGNRFLGKVSIHGNGISQQETLARETAITQTTNFIPVKDGDTISGLLSTCSRLYTKKVKRNLSTDLRNTIKSFFQFDNNGGLDGLTILTDAALYGPVKWANAIGFEWYVNPVTWYIPAGSKNLSNSGIFMINGELEQIRNLLPNRKVTYQAKFKDGEMVMKVVSVDTGKAWKKAAHQLIDLIINEAYHEFKPSLSELNPAEKEFVTFFKDSNYKGQALRLGVGQYTGKSFSEKGFANVISSFNIPKGFEVELYDLKDLRGKHFNAKESMPLLEDWKNDSVQAVVIKKIDNYTNYYTLKSEWTSFPTGNHFMVDAKKAWGFKHIDNGYFQMIEKSSGKCLGYNNTLNWTLQTCDINNKTQTWTIEQANYKNDKDELVTINGVYEILSKYNSYQMKLNKYFEQDQRKVVLMPGKTDVNSTRFWKFTNISEIPALTCQQECQDVQNGCNTDTVCDTFCE